jgi:hypothetical protein
MKQETGANNCSLNSTIAAIFSLNDQKTSFEILGKVFVVLLPVSVNQKPIIS